MSESNGSISADTPVKIPLDRHLEDVAERAANKALEKWEGKWLKVRGQTCPKAGKINRTWYGLLILVALLMGLGVISKWPPI